MHVCKRPVRCIEIFFFYCDSIPRLLINKIILLHFSNIYFSACAILSNFQSKSIYLLTEFTCGTPFSRCNDVSIKSLSFICSSEDNFKNWVTWNIQFFAQYFLMSVFQKQFSNVWHSFYKRLHNIHCACTVANFGDIDQSGRVFQLVFILERIIHERVLYSYIKNYIVEFSYFTISFTTNMRSCTTESLKCGQWTYRFYFKSISPTFGQLSITLQLVFHNLRICAFKWK